MQRYYPWLMAIMGLLVLLISNGLTVTGITAFDESLLREFGWSRGALKFRDLLTLLLAGLMAPFMGIVIDKVGPRRLIIAGFVLLALLYLAYSRVTSITHLYLIHVGFGAVLVAAGLNVAVIMVSQWFVAKRGAAIGIALVGTSLGGVVFPRLVVAMLESMDWRQAFMLLALVPVAMLALVLVLVRAPRQMGLQPLGASRPRADDDDHADHRTSPDGLPDMSYRQALRTRTFWALATVAMATFYSIMAASAHMFLHMRDMGYDPATASQALAVMFGCGMIGKFVFGFLADLFPPKRVFLANIGIMVVGALLLATLRPGLVWYALVLFGLGWGGLYTMIQLLAVNAFGLSSAGKILGTITMLDAATAGLGIWITALLFDHFGNYQVAFNVLAALVVLAFVVATQIRNERRATAAPGA